MRELIGYGLLEGGGIGQGAQIYLRQVFENFCNFFCPVMKLVRAEVKGSGRRRFYDKAMTSFERLRHVKTLPQKNWIV